MAGDAHIVCRLPRDYAAAHAKYLASRCAKLPFPSLLGKGPGDGVCRSQRKQGRAAGSPLHRINLAKLVNTTLAVNGAARLQVAFV